MSVNWDLLNRADYESFSGVKEMLVLYNAHKRNAARGDTVSHSILMDLDAAIYSGVLTKKQLEAVELFCMHNMPQEKIAEYIKVSREAIKFRLEAAVNNIQKILISGRLFQVDTTKIAYNPYCNIEGDIYSGTAEEVLWDG